MLVERATKATQSSISESVRLRLILRDLPLFEILELASSVITAVLPSLWLPKLSWCVWCRPRQDERDSGTQRCVLVKKVPNSGRAVGIAALGTVCESKLHLSELNLECLNLARNVSGGERRSL